MDNGHALPMHPCMHTAIMQDWTRQSLLAFLPNRKIDIDNDRLVVFPVIF